MQRSHRHVELVVVRVVDAEELPVRAADGQDFEARVAPDAMCLVHHRRPDSKLAEIAHHPFEVAPDAAPATPLGGARAEELRFGDDRNGRGADPRAVLEPRDRHPEQGVAGDERAPGLDELRLRAVRCESLQQDLPPSRRFRDDETATGL